MDWLIAHQTEILVNLVSSGVWAVIAYVFVKRNALINKALQSLAANERGLATIEIISSTNHPKALRVIYLWFRQSIGGLACAVGFLATGSAIIAWDAGLTILFIFACAAIIFVLMTLNQVWPRRPASETKIEVMDAVREILTDFSVKISVEKEIQANQAPEPTPPSGASSDD